MSKKPDPDIEEAKLLYLADIISIREDNERLKKRINELDMKNWQLTKEINILRKREKERKERLAARRTERSMKEVREVPEVQEVQKVQEEYTIRGIIDDYGVIRPLPPKRNKK